MRRFSAVLLIFSLLASAFATASARGTMAGTLDMVICTGSGLTTLTIDAQGDPVETYESCPDCVMTLAAPLPQTPDLRAAQTQVSALRWAPWTPVWHGQAGLPAKARGPPRAA